MISLLPGLMWLMMSIRNIIIGVTSSDNLSHARKCYFPSISDLIISQYSGMREEEKAGQEHQPDHNVNCLCPCLLKARGLSHSVLPNQRWQVSQGSHQEALSPYYQNQLAAGQLGSFVKAVNR